MFSCNNIRTFHKIYRYETSWKILLKILNIVQQIHNKRSYHKNKKNNTILKSISHKQFTEDTKRILISQMR